MFICGLSLFQYIILPLLFYFIFLPISKAILKHIWLNQWTKICLKKETMEIVWVSMYVCHVTIRANGSQCPFLSVLFGTGAFSQ